MDSRIVELGAGCCGIPGQVAAALGGNVILTDIDDEIVGLKGNVFSNAQHHKNNVIVEELNWSEIRHKNGCLADSMISNTAIDLILCADLVYERTYKDLAVTLLHLLKLNPQAIVLMSNAMRKHVHLFRRRMSLFCTFEDIGGESVGDMHDAVWIIKLIDTIDINDEAIQSTFSN